MFFAIRRAYRRRGRSILAAFTLACVAACAVGVPLPAIVFKAIAERFPCELHPCGCVDAEACWRDCCCMSHAEKLAWAKRAGVEPPAYVIAAAARQLIADSSGESSAAKSSCCAAKSSCGDAAASCTAAKPEQAGGGCCGAKAQTPEQRSMPGGARFLVLHEAMKCRGLSVTVALLPPSLPVTVAELLPLPVVVHAVPCTAENLYQSPKLAIDAPPPDAARA